MTVTAVLVNDQPVALDSVEFEVQVTHGRNDIRSQPEASNAQVILRGQPGVDLEIGDELRIGAYGGVCRFRGTITDLRREHLSSSPPIPVTTVTAMGFLAKLGLLTTGEDGYTRETIRQRVDEVMADSGIDYVNAADDNLEVQANNEPGISTKLNYLQSLAEWSGGTYFDDCRGRVIFEDYGNRGQAGNPGTWSNATEPWSFYTQAWDAFPATNAAPQIPALDVIWAPQWTKNLQTLINNIEVEYKNDGLVELTDSGSIADYGLRKYDLITELESAGDATERAQQILTSQSRPLWSLGQVSVLMHRLDAPERDRVLALVSGSRVIINGLPEGSPYNQFQGIVEGWSETFTENRHVLTLSLSDPRNSYQVVTWEELDAAVTWGDVDPTIEWYNVVVADDLIGV
ncbi:MAG TPA: hypothetical protein VIG24_09015 [Acidimicrobiia bacterium]